MKNFHVILRWIEWTGPDGEWREERDDFYVIAENEVQASFKATKILDYQCSDYGEGSQVRVHYGSAEPIDEPFECEYEQYFGENGFAVGKTYPHYIDIYSMRIISPDSLEYIPEYLRKIYQPLFE